jgi:hypothetical protein
MTHPQSRYLRQNPGSATRATWVARQYGLHIPEDVLSYIQYLLEAPRRAAKMVNAMRSWVVARKEDRFLHNIDSRQPGNLMLIMQRSMQPAYIARQLALSTRELNLRFGMMQAMSSHNPATDPLVPGWALRAMRKMDLTG